MRLFLVGVSLGALAVFTCTAPATPPTAARAHQIAEQAPSAPESPPVAGQSLARSHGPDPQPGGPAFKLVPERALPSLGATGGAGVPIFRGGAGLARPAAPNPVTPPRTSNLPLLPAPSVYSSLNKPGIAAGDNVTLGNPGVAVPPDSTGAIGPNNYVEMANSVVHVWGRDLSSVSAASFDTFLGTPGNPYCDPQVQWDPAAGRWLFVILLCNTGSSTQFFVFGWSKTADPSDLVNGWCAFGINTSPFILDYPKLGHNKNYLIVGGNFYDMTTPSGNPPFVSAALAWIPLPSPGDSSCTAPSTFGHTSTSPSLKNGDGVTRAFTPVPVNTMTSANDGYIVSSYDVGNNVQPPAPQNRLAVWHLDSAGVLHQDPDIGVGSYSMPAPATQLGSPNLIDTLDGRLTQAVGDPTSGIWTQHTVAGGLGAMVAWYELSVSGASLTLTQAGNVSSATDFIFNAAISPSYSARGAAIFYSRSNATIDPVIAAQVRVISTPAGQMASSELVLAASAAADVETLSCNKGGLPCRWGDYSAASPDPVQPYVVWGTNEITKAATATPAWGDENFAVVAGVPPGAPAIGSASTGQDRFSCVAWTPSTSDTGGVPDVSYTIKAYNGATLAASAVINAPTTFGCIKGLTDGTTYTLTVLATNAAGSGAESGASNPVTPMRGAGASSSAASSSRSPVNPAPTAPPPPPR